MMHVQGWSERSFVGAAGAAPPPARLCHCHFGTTISKKHVPPWFGKIHEGTYWGALIENGFRPRG